MNAWMQVPDWLGAAVIGAVVAALGYVARLVVESWLRILEKKNARRARLVELQSLLRAAWVSFSVQKQHAKRLLAMVRKNHADLVGKEKGYERTFARAYEAFTEEERELHGIIRSITIHSLRPVNQALSHWLKNDTHFKAQGAKRGPMGELAEYLANLEAHLVLWHAKYETWIPHAKEHALVYLADEERHGVGFPAGIERIVQAALTSR